MKFQTKYGDIYCSTVIYCSKSVFPAIVSISYMAVVLSIFRKNGVSSETHHRTMLRAHRSPSRRRYRTIIPSFKISKKSWFKLKIDYFDFPQTWFSHTFRFIFRKFVNLHARYSTKNPLTCRFDTRPQSFFKLIVR